MPRRLRRLTRVLTITYSFRSWLNDFRIRESQLAEQVHLFSSFFYTQLRQKKYVTIFSINHRLTFLAVWRKVIKVYVNGHPELTYSRRITLLYRLMNSEPTSDTIYD